MKKLLGGTVLAGFALLAIVATALATSGSGVTKNETLALGNVADIDVKVKTGDWKVNIDTKGPSTVAVSEIRVAPGGNFGWHSHPGPSFVIVKSGTSTFYDGDDPDCTPQRHPAGTAYVDPGGDTHIARNEGTEELVLFVTRVVPEGATPRIDEPNPGNCPF
ncbi:MAG: cupin domain-containing protein [Actinobacteria bacterium]|nr:cupin domain-containing protein [Actinomycetota bacterium]